MPATPQKSSRQRPGSACEECRRRKVRCDRRRPQCQVCFETGVECKISTARLPRGPRKGQLRTLRTRIAALERCLADQHPEMNHQLASIFDGSVIEYPSDDDTVREVNLSGPESLPENGDAGSSSPKLPTSPKPSASPSASPTTNSLVSDIICADLDQLYFDRVHSFAPILQRWRYHSWAKKSKKTSAQICLQYAMWTLAASLSAHYQYIRDTLYQETRQMLDNMDLKFQKADVIGLEQAQAWVLISIYEYTQLSPLQAWMSAGTCCRLVLGMRLYELDDPNSPITFARDHGPTLVDWTVVEEQRRTFWMAYSLDRFISFHNGLPFTLNEQLISTRLPTPEAEFQAGQPVVTNYLSEVISSSSSDDNPGTTNMFSSFGECIILATICGRALSHRQRLTVEQINGDMFQEFWIRHQWLHEILNQRIQALATTTQVDPMLIFSRIVVQTMILFLHNVLESITWKTGDHLLSIIEYERLCVLAAHEVVNLLKLQAQLGYFKVHPLTPIPLTICTDFFSVHGYLDSSFNMMHKELLKCLQDLNRVKNLVQSPRLPIPC